METTYTSTAEFCRLVRNFSQRTPSWALAIRHWVTPDEAFDPTLISQNVYGTRREFMAVIAAAGVDSLEQEITPRLLVLPTADQLAVLKARTGFYADRDNRSNALSANPVLAR
jgi:hypothetical protein